VESIVPVGLPQLYKKVCMAGRQGEKDAAGVSAVLTARVTAGLTARGAMHRSVVRAGLRVVQGQIPVVQKSKKKEQFRINVVIVV